MVDGIHRIKVDRQVFLFSWAFFLNERWAMGELGDGIFYAGHRVDRKKEFHVEMEGTSPASDGRSWYVCTVLPQ